MRISNTFVVPADADRAWQALLDIERVAPCMPGAALQDFDGESFSGTVSVKLGALGMKYQGSGRFLERDEVNRRVSFEAKGRETRGSGTASATVVASLHPDGESTRVDVDTELNVGGRAAQFGRSVLNDVAARLLGQFADALAKELDEPATESPMDVAAAPPAEGAAGARSAPWAVQPIDLMDVGRAVLVKRAVLPLASVVGMLVVLGWLRRRSRRARRHGD